MSDAAPSDVAPVPAAAVAEVKAPVVAAKEPEPTDDYEIDGRKVTLTRTQARTHIQKSGAVDKRLQEATEKQKSLDARIAEFEADPEAALAKMGKDPTKILEAMLARKAKLELMTPEQREAQALRDERDALKKEADKTAAEKKAALDKEMDEHKSMALEQQLIGAADAHGLDASPETLEGLCDVALELLELGLTPTADQVAQEFIRRDQEHLEARDRKIIPKLKGERLKTYLKANVAALLTLPPAELLELLGPAGVKAVQAATLTKLPGAVKVRAPVVAAPPRNGMGRYMTEGTFDSKRR